MIIENGHAYFNDFVGYFKNNTLIPIVGSGISVNVKQGKFSIPSGKIYKDHMISKILNAKGMT